MQAGYNLTGREHTSTLQKRWKEYRKQYQAQTGTMPPTVYEQARAYDEADLPTIDFGRDYIAQFIDHVEMIYRDTLKYIYDNREGTHESGKLASIAYNHMMELHDKYQQIVSTIRSMVDSGIPLEIIAQAIADNVELDYVLGVALQPPSDVIFLFDETIEQLQGVMAQINARASELAEQEEAEYYGE